MGQNRSVPGLRRHPGGGARPPPRLGPTGSVLLRARRCGAAPDSRLQVSGERPGWLAPCPGAGLFATAGWCLGATPTGQLENHQLWDRPCFRARPPSRLPQRFAGVERVEPTIVQVGAGRKIKIAAGPADLLGEERATRHGADPHRRRDHNRENPAQGPADPGSSDASGSCSHGCDRNCNEGLASFGECR